MFCDVEFEWKMEELRDWARRGAEEGRTHRRIVVASVPPPSPLPPSQGEEHREQEQTTNTHCIAGHQFALPASFSLSSFVLLFIGSPISPLLTTLMLTYNDIPAYLYDPSLPTPSPIPSTSSPAIRRLLSRRFYLTQHALSSRIIGLLIGVVSHNGVLPILERLQRLIKAAGKKAYVVAVGKVNPSKLANFSDIDVWCLISCPFAAILPEGGRGYFREVVTPRELEMALTGQAWTGQYSTDFTVPLKEEKGGEGEEGEEGEGEGDVVYDSATGKLRGALPTFAGGGSAVIRREDGQVVRTAVDAMRERSWKGLETERDRRLRLQKEAKEEAELGGGDEGDGRGVEERIKSAVVEAGLEGIASRYTKERKD